MIKAASVALDVNLQHFSHFLRGHGIRHRINEESGQQVIWVDSAAEAEAVQDLLQRWRFDEEPDIAAASPLPAQLGSRLLRGLLRGFRDSPVTLGLVIACLLVALVSELGARPDRVSWLFYPRLATDGLLPLLAGLTDIESLVRSLTPMFLHFGELHLVFNMLWLWYFGRQLEAIHPHWVFLGLILAMDFAGNTTQYLYSHYNNFGGMSGVVYGLVGYAWVIHQFMPRSRLLLNNSMFVVFVVALVVMELVASSWIASAAHVGGLVMGLLLGAGMVVYYRFLRRQDVISK